MWYDLASSTHHAMTAWPYKGPRGGRYRINDKGRKVYDRPKASERKFTDDGQSIRGLAVAAERARSEQVQAARSTSSAPDLSPLFFFHIFIWLLAILCGWGWGHGALFPLNALWATVNFMWDGSHFLTLIEVGTVIFFLALPFINFDDN